MEDKEEELKGFAELTEGITSLGSISGTSVDQVLINENSNHTGTIWNGGQHRLINTNPYQQNNLVWPHQIPGPFGSTEPTLGEIMHEISQMEERLMELKQIAINKMDIPEEKIERRKLL